MDLKDYLSNRRVLRNIKRFNMEKVLHPQNLADHGYNVANLFYLLCKEFGFQITVKDLHIVMNHDFVEVFTGDLNLSIKRKIAKLWDEIEETIVPESLHEYINGGIKENLNKDIYPIFLFADAFEAYLYCEDEVAMGNSLLSKALNNYSIRLTKLNPKMFQHLNTIRKEIREK